MSVPSQTKMQSRRELGAAVKRWMRLNDLSQQNIHDWAVAAESEGPWNSQMSLFTTDNDVKRLDPKSQFWVSLARFNKAIADNSTPPALKRLIVDRIKAGEPFPNAAGDPATATDLFSMFIGEQQLPEQCACQISKQYTNEEAAEISGQLHRAYRGLATDAMISPMEAWAQLQALCEDMSEEQVLKFKAVLAGWEVWTAEELQDLTPDREQLHCPGQALTRMAKRLGVDVSL